MQLSVAVRSRFAALCEPAFMKKFESFKVQWLLISTPVGFIQSLNERTLGHDGCVDSVDGHDDVADAQDVATLSPRPRHEVHDPRLRFERTTIEILI